MPAPPLPTRRDVVRVGLTLAAGAALVACTRGSDGSQEPTAPGGPKDPDRLLRAEVGAQEAALSALYVAAAAKLDPAQSTAVTALGARHAAYRQAVDPDGLATQSPSGSPSGTAAPGATRSATPSPPPSLPRGAADIIAALRKAERDAATSRVAQSVRAVDAELARLIVLAGTGAAGAAEVLVRGVA